MTNRMLLFVFLMFNVNMVRSQLCTQYDCSYSKDVDCYFTLYKNGLYEIVLYKDYTEDLSSNTTLAYGKYVYQNGKITCYDQYSGFQMVYSYNPKYLQPEKAFFGLKNKKLLLDQYHTVMPNDKPDFLDYKGISESLRQIKSEFKKSQKILNDFKPAIYDDSFGERILILQPDHRYRMLIYNIIMSNGTWSLQGNELVLYDEDLKCKFYAFIKKDKLICGLFSINDRNILMVRRK